ncbi:MAG: hypothetical protein ACJA13_001317 [Paraglaciecola sp.]|jgi:hypothetical protein
MAGYNRIEKAHYGCAWTEHYQSPGGFNGQSLNIFAAKRQKGQ